MTRLAAAVLCLLLGACGDGASAPPSQQLTPEQAARGRSERAFWTSFDAAKVLLRTGDETAAAEQLEAALAQKPEHASALYFLAGIRWRERRHADALDLAERLELVDRPKSRSLLLQARIRSDVDGLGPRADRPSWFDLDAAAQNAREAELVNPEETGAHVVRARIALLRGIPDEALASLDRALTLHPGHVEARVLQVEALRRAGDLDAARAALGKALRETAPSSDDAPAVIGDGDVDDGGARRRHERRLVLTLLLRYGGHAWPADGGPEPDTVLLDGVQPAAASVTDSVRADLDGDGVDEELRARRTEDADALGWLFGAQVTEPTFSVRSGTDDRTAELGLEGVAACAGTLHAGDADGDGRPDVLVLPREHDPGCALPALLLRPGADGTVEVVPVRWSERYRRP